jgi:hypothetical protein
MASGLYFDYATITGRPVESDARFHAGPAQALARSLREDGLPLLGTVGGRFYGLWTAQFGLASSQLVLMTYWDRRQGVSSAVEEMLSSLEAVECIDHHLVVPTARPKTAEPPSRPGIYVHRWFDVEPRHVDEIVELSAAAWETFERTFEVEVIGFFLRLVEPGAESTQLMLLNWYPSLAAWEASRNFDADPESKRNFVRRAELTTGTRAITTALVA